jgi:hypothetical protein
VPTKTDTTPSIPPYTIGEIIGPNADLRSENKIKKKREERKSLLEKLFSSKRTPEVASFAFHSLSKQEKRLTRNEALYE